MDKKKSFRKKSLSTGVKPARPNRTSYKKIATTSGTESEVGDEAETDTTLTSIQGQSGQSGASSTDQEDLNQLTTEEEDFFDLIFSGNVTGAALMLKEDSSHIDINKQNINGYTVLQIAVQREDEEMVEMLLNVDGIELNDSLFLAIREDNIDIVRKIVEHECNRGSKPPYKKRDNSTGYLDALARCKLYKDKMTNSEFEEDLTCIMLAAHCSSFELIEYFYNLGDYLPEKPEHEGDIAGMMKTGYRRLRWYKAISNPYYLSFMANEDPRIDPILQAFYLTDEMKRRALDEPEFKSEYEEMVEILIEYTGDMLDLCRTGGEVQLVCRQKEGFTGHNSSFPRLLLAIEHEQMDFVVHPFSQQVLYNWWKGSWDDWTNYGPFMRLLQVIIYFILMPVIALGLSVAPTTSDYANKFRMPVMRFLLALASYIYFLILILLEIFLPFDEKDTSPSRGWEYGTVHILFTLFIFGHIVSILRELCFWFHQHFKLLWNWFELLNQTLYIVILCLWLAAYCEAPPIEEIDKKFGDRKYWSQWTVLLVSEALFAVATIMSFVRLLRIFQLHSVFGPLQIALGYMVRDYGKGIVFYAITIFSFASGYTMLYKAYHNMSSYADTTDDKIYQEEQYTSFRSSIQSLFWSLFNLSPTSGTTIIEVKPLVIPAMSKTLVEHLKERGRFHHIYTQRTGEFIFKAFQVLNVLMFANTIVSMIANRAGEVFENKEREWRFARAQVWILFGHDAPAPSPFNLIYTLIHPCCLRRAKNEYKTGCSLERCIYRDKIDTKSDEEIRTEYAKLIKVLLLRYFREKSEEGLGDPATTEQVTRIREDVTEMKEKCRRLIYKLKGEKLVVKSFRRRSWEVGSTMPGPKVKVVQAPKRFSK